MKKKDKKKLVIALVVLAGVILAGLGIWNYAVSDGNFLRFNQKMNLPDVAPIESAPPSDIVPVELPSEAFQDSGMDGFQDSGMDGFK